MATITISKEQKKVLKPVLGELKRINTYLKKLLVIIPEESLKDYKKSSQIKNSYLKAIRNYPPKE
jgi:hypothetical protein